jgi:hypothetical protein
MSFHTFPSRSSAAHLFFQVWVMNVPSCGVTFVPLHVGHLTLAFPLSEKVMLSSNGVLHFSHMNSYLGMVILPDRSPSRPAHSARPRELLDEHQGLPKETLRQAARGQWGAGASGCASARSHPRTESASRRFPQSADPGGGTLAPRDATGVSQPVACMLKHG